MTSLWGPLLALVLQLEAVPSTNPVTGKPWNDHLLPACSDLVPQALRKQWKLSPSPSADPGAADTGKVHCWFHTQAEKDVSAVYHCGASKLVAPQKKSSGRPSPTRLELQDLGRQARARIDTKGGRVFVWAYDDDTPCEVMLEWPGAGDLETAKRLMKGLLAAATPAVVGMQRLEVLYLDPQSVPGRALLASAEAWKKEALALDGLMTFAAGFPKVVDGKSIPGLPEGKLGLLGVCPYTGPGPYVAEAALPGLRTSLVDAPGIAPACPKTTYLGTSWEYEGESEVKLGEETLSMGFYYIAQDPRVLRARAYLRGADGGLVSVAKDELPMDSSVLENDCRATLRKNKSGATFRVQCQLGTPDRCKRNPLWSVSYALKVAANKVTIKVAPSSTPGVDCQPTHE